MISHSICGIPRQKNIPLPDIRL
jgi:hypothetical protein